MGEDLLELFRRRHLNSRLAALLTSLAAQHQTAPHEQPPEVDVSHLVCIATDTFDILHIYSLKLAVYPAVPPACLLSRTQSMRQRRSSPNQLSNSH